MTEKPFLQEYTGQSTAELIALEGEYRLDSIVLAFANGLEHKAQQIGFDALSFPEKAVYVIEEFERQFNSGGFSTLFQNVPEYAEPSVYYLTEIGCTRSAELCKQALQLLDIGEPMGDEPLSQEAIERCEALRDEAVLDEMCAMEKELFDDYEPISENLFAFIKERRDEIVL
jgi:hypothetical protein